MIAILGIVAFLTALVILLIVGRLATLALMMTGLSKDIARFQSRSALTGAGFTTRESESVIDRPVRRRIIELLMVAQSAGLATIVVSLVLSFSGGSGSGLSIASRLLWLGGGLAVFLIVANSRLVERILDRAMSWALRRWTSAEVLDYAGLLRLHEGYRVTSLRLPENAWLAHRDIGELNLRDEGVILLGVERTDGSYVAIPTAGTRLYPGDMVILYGRDDALQRLHKRREGPAGDREHERARGDEEARRQEQEMQDAEHQRQRQLEEENLEEVD